MKDGEDNLKHYREKRDWGLTPEPGPASQKSSHDAPIFVIQKHDATQLHYDFRLEADGVLKSWVIPKGPSTDPRQKRLAIPTEDHPLEYAGFEGVIPEGNYGAGTVLIWDQGSYDNTTEQDGQRIPVSEGIGRGRLTFYLHGKKLQGGYALVRTGGDSDNWLLIKMADDAANARRNPVSTEPRSVVTDRSLEDIENDARTDDSTKSSWLHVKVPAANRARRDCLVRLGVTSIQDG